MSAVASANPVGRKVIGTGAARAVAENETGESLNLHEIVAERSGGTAPR